MGGWWPRSDSMKPIPSRRAGIAPARPSRRHTLAGAMPTRSGLSFDRGRLAALEIRLVRDRDVIVEQMPVVLGADLFEHRLPHARVTLDGRPGLIVSVRVLDPDAHFHRLAVVDLPPALRNVQLLGVRRTVTIDERLVVHR